MNQHPPSLIDLFEEIVQLQKTSPELVNDRIDQILNKEIERIANGDEERLQKLRQQQWVINGELRKFKDPVARMNKMAELFWVGVHKFIDTTKMS